GGGGGGGEAAGTGGGPTVGAYLRAILAGRPGTPAPVEGGGGSPLDAAFAHSFPEPDPMPGTPTHAASDTISLDQVFGEESGRSSAGAAPEASASAPSASPAPPAPPAPPAGFSFDEFFGASAGRSPGSPPAPKPP